MDYLAQEPWNFVFRIFVAAAFGGVLGLERDEPPLDDFDGDY